ncbi:hypothetical protein BH11ACT1_BH11ACT1_05360 [soil metagenome]
MRSMAVSAAAALGLVLGGGATGALHSAAELPARIFAPAYDTVTVANLNTLALALTSYGLDAGRYDGLTLEALTGWGWTPSDSTAVTIWVARDGFRVVAQDVRVGAAQYELRSVAGQSPAGGIGRSATQPAEPPAAATVTVVRTATL